MPGLRDEEDNVPGLGNKEDDTLRPGDKEDNMLELGDEEDDTLDLRITHQAQEIMRKRARPGWQGVRPIKPRQ